jgi:WD40 repeat protein
MVWIFYSEIMESELDLSKKYLITSSLDSSIKIFDLNTFDCLKTLKGHTEGVKCIEIISFKDSKLISGSLDKSLKLWNLDAGACTKTLNFHSYGIKCMQTLPDDKIASGSFQEIKIIDLRSETCLKTLSSDLAWVHTLKLLPNGFLATCTECHSISPNGGIELWDINTGKLVSTLSITDNSKSQESMELFRCLCLINERTLASSSTDVPIPLFKSMVEEQRVTHQIKIWNLDTEKCEKNILVQEGLGENFKNSRIELLVLNQRNELISLTRDNGIKIWNLEKKEPVKLLPIEPDNRIMCLKCFKDNLLITGSSDKKIKIWNLDTLACIRVLNEHDDTVTDIKII